MLLAFALALQINVLAAAKWSARSKNYQELLLSLQNEACF